MLVHNSTDLEVIHRLSDVLSEMEYSWLIGLYNFEREPINLHVDEFYVDNQSHRNRGKHKLEGVV
jgi:hypothetical protein